MKTILLRVFLLLRWPIDLVLSVIAAPSALALLAYRRIGSKRLPITTHVLKTIGLFPIRRHYHEPLFDHSVLAKPLSDDRELPGIDLNLTGQLELCVKLTYSQELIDEQWSVKPTNPASFYFSNSGPFPPGDAEFLYQFIRATKPKKVIEVGSGQSTKIARRALLRNHDESNIPSTHICIEPYEASWLESLSGIEVVRKCVEDYDVDWSQALAAGDLLFVDSSHIIRPQGDVLKECLEIFPQLASGVYIHIHDIFTPKDYPYDSVVRQVSFWNEQYLLLRHCYPIARGTKSSRR